MAVELRQVSPDDYPTWIKNLDLTFGFDYDPEEDTLRSLLDFSRTLGHYADGRYVSTVSAFNLEMTVPGAVVPCGGTTVITVAPTHRRRGLLTEMMGRHLADIREHEEPIAALWASESEIYGRFGYGAATLSARVNVTRPYPALSPLAAEPADVRLVDESEARTLVPQFHNRFRVDQPGMFARWQEWWDGRVFNDLPSRRADYTAARWVVVDGSEGIDGYARYRVKTEWSGDGHGSGEVLIQELFADRSEAWAGLWNFLLNQDLMGRFVARLRSPDDPIFEILEGPRRALAQVNDGIWVRVMDVVSALESRSYAADFQGVIKVVDDMGIADGTFRLDISPAGSSVKSTNDDPDIVVDVHDLGSIYLGRAGLARKARAGRVIGDMETLRRADRAFAWDPQPWCPEVF